jgi:hypothetical protein
MKISRKNLAELEKKVELEFANKFTEEEINQLAKESGFVRRKSPLDGFKFLDLIVFCSDHLVSQSLNDMCIDAKERHGIEIKKQSLNERFNETALILLKKFLEEIIATQHETELQKLREIEGFKRILIKDSTSFQLHESLADIYPGSGGAGSKASARIQFEYDILSGKINDLSINAFNDQDSKNSVETIELTQAGDLIIRDLAYITMPAIKLIEKIGAYYLGRLSPQVNAYETNDRNDNQKICFDSIRKYMEKNNISVLEKEIYIGAKERIKTRLIIYLIPAQEVEKRIRKATKNNKKKCRKDLTKEYISWLHLNLFITNADETMTPAAAVWPLYRLRWQIELTFKIWKSYFGIEKVKKVKQHRLECYLYSKLIIILLAWKIIWTISKHMFKHEGLSLSFMKTFKTIARNKITVLREIFLLKTKALKEFLNDFYPICITKLLLERKKGNPTSVEILMGV